MNETKTAPARPVRSTDSRITRLEDLMGEEPSVLGGEGRGVLGKLATIDKKLDELLELMTQRRAVALYVAKVAAVPFVGGIVALALHWAITLHH